MSVDFMELFAPQQFILRCSEKWASLLGTRRGPQPQNAGHRRMARKLLVVAGKAGSMRSNSRTLVTVKVC
jgi:hypothetical protein